jgi:general secretion pathway protein B
MSFILDALRKSEHARERRALPGLVDLPVSRTAPSRLPWILAGLGALLLVNIGVLVWVLARPPAPPAPPALPAAPVAPTPTATATSAPARAAFPVAAPRPAPQVRPLAAEGEPGADPQLDRVETSQPPPRAAPEPYAAERAAAEREFHPRVASGGVPSIHQLPAQATAGLPALNIDLHVYSADPAQRFVIINGQRLRQGGQLKEGPTVEQITPEGAILDHQGTRFLLPHE